MTFNTTYRIYFGDKAFDFLNLKDCEEEVKYQRVVNNYNPPIFEVTWSYQGEQLVNTEEKALPGG